MHHTNTRMVYVQHYRITASRTEKFPYIRCVYGSGQPHKWCKYWSGHLFHYSDLLTPLLILDLFSLPSRDMCGHTKDAWCEQRRHTPTHTFARTHAFTLTRTHTHSHQHIHPHSHSYTHRMSGLNGGCLRSDNKRTICLRAKTNSSLLHIGGSWKRTRSGSKAKSKGACSWPSFLFLAEQPLAFPFSRTNRSFKGRAIPCFPLFEDKQNRAFKERNWTPNSLIKMSQQMQAWKVPFVLVHQALNRRVYLIINSVALSR